MNDPLFIFIIYARENRMALDELKKHLKPLVRNRDIDFWDEGMILPGAEPNKEIKEKLNTADIVLLLISSDFLANDKIYEEYLPIITERHKNGYCKAIPIIVEICYWQADPFINKLKPLPLSEKPIISDDRYLSNALLTEVVIAIQEVVAAIQQDRSLQVQPVLEELTENLDDETPEEDLILKKNIKTDKVLTSFRHASIQLQNWKGHFERLPNSHLERPETFQIINWIDDPLPQDEKGIALLVGDAGAGKSVILRDVLQTLEDRKIPVLGIKADQYCVENIELLEKRLNLNEGIELMIKSLAQSNERVVVLIDQIDALSQSLSARREYLETFTRLVVVLSEIPTIRIVLSCRTYDLYNDHDFAFYSRQKKIQINTLSDEQVRDILQQLSPNMPDLPRDLLALLKTPLHLDVYCRIYRPDLPFEKIKVLRDLYEEFWIRRVADIDTPADRKVDPVKISNLIFELARTMYVRQSLVVPVNQFRTRFAKELRYIKSVGIVSESSEDIVFFHQTFYDFSFAKQFVERGNSVQFYLLENEQSLHIRSSLKMIMEFLRESNPYEYLVVLQTILISQDYYFHIKSLLLSLLGFVKNPTGEEMQLVRKYVFPEPSFFKAFVNTVKSREWLLFLLDEKQLQWLVQQTIEPTEVEGDKVEREQFSNRVNMLNGLLLRHLPESRHEVLEFLSDFPEVEYKPWLVERTLHNLETWDDPRAFRLFDSYFPNFQDYFFAEFLKKAVRTNLPWAFQHLRAAISKVVGNKNSHYDEFNFEHSLAELITQYIQNYPEPTFGLLLDFLDQLLLSPKYRNRQKAVEAIFSDFPWFSLDFDNSNRDNTGLFPLTIDCVRVLAKNKSVRFSKFISESLGSQSATKFLILIEGFRANPSAYNADIVQFFHVFMEKRGFDTTETLAWRARQLLKEAYHHFNDKQKRNILHLISQIESEAEKEWALENNRPEWIGIARLQWLKCFPESEITQVPSVEQTFKELIQRFPDMEDREPNKIRTYWVGPPMERDEYEKMTSQDWIASFLAYNENYAPVRGSHKGGMEQHANQFKIEVEKRPDYFFPLIDELTALKGLPKTYLIHGLEGLKEAKYNPQNILNLFKKIDLSEFESWDIRRLISLCEYFAAEKLEDDFVFNFLVQIAKTNSDPADDSIKVIVGTNETSSVYISGYNSVRGSAVNVLIQFYYFKKYENLLFETLEYIAEHDLLQVRSQIMPQLAMLTNLDKPRSLRLFLRLVRDNEAAIMEHSAWSAKYFARQDFKAMKPYFTKALGHPKLHKDMAVILSLIWIFEQDDAFDLLNQFIEKSVEAKTGAIDVAAHNIRDNGGNPNGRSVELFARFLQETDEKLIRAYDSAFRHLKPKDFPHLLATLVRFSKSVFARKNPRPFYEYLIACATTYPIDCLTLVENFAAYEKPEIYSSGHYNTEPLKVVINAYNALWGRKIKDKVMLKKALLLFDQMLLDDRFSRNAETVLIQVER